MRNASSKFGSAMAVIIAAAAVLLQFENVLYLFAGILLALLTTFMSRKLLKLQLLNSFSAGLLGFALIQVCCHFYKFIPYEGPVCYWKGFVIGAGIITVLFICAFIVRWKVHSLKFSAFLTGILCWGGVVAAGSGYVLPQLDKEAFVEWKFETSPPMRVKWPPQAVLFRKNTYICFMFEDGSEIYAPMKMEVVEYIEQGSDIFFYSSDGKVADKIGIFNSNFGYGRELDYQLIFE